MHFSEGIFSIGHIAAGYAVTAGLAAYSLKKTESQDIPEISVIAAGFFTASLIHFKVGVTSVHLTLIGLTAVLLGNSAPLAILTGLFFQAIMFQHGGISTLGINGAIMTIPALLGSFIFRHMTKRRHDKILFSSIAGGCSAFIAVSFASLLSGAVLISSDMGLSGFALFFTAGNSILAVVEGILTAVIVSRILKTKPEMIRSWE